jgi:hypothetical protein
MIKIVSPPNAHSSRYCDGITRRDFVRAGALAFGGLAIAPLSLPELFRAEAAAGIRTSQARGSGRDPWGVHKHPNEVAGLSGVRITAFVGSECG